MDGRKLFRWFFGSEGTSDITGGEGTTSGVEGRQPICVTLLKGFYFRRKWETTIIFEKNNFGADLGRTIVRNPLRPIPSVVS